MNFKFKEALEILTGVPYSADVYVAMSRYIMETSDIILMRQRRHPKNSSIFNKLILNAEISATIQAKWPVDIPRQEYLTCEALGLKLVMDTGLIRIVVYITRDKDESVCYFVDMFTKNGATQYHRVNDNNDPKSATDEIPVFFDRKAKDEDDSSSFKSSSSNSDLLPSPSSSSSSNESRKKRASPTPVSRIEADALSHNLLEGKEDVDWYAKWYVEESVDNSFFDIWPLTEEKQLVLQQDFSAVHAELKPGFAFDSLTVFPHKKISITIGEEGNPKKVYTLKLKACEFVAGDDE